jgi:SAM-dependent MidA family methyltransferase
LSILAESLMIRAVVLPPATPALPPPPPEAQAVSDELRALIAEEIRAHGGWMCFARFMELALYAPGLGYYSAGSRKLGAEGDFITAPELSTLFGRCIARQVADLVAQGVPAILEVGAGSGALAADVLNELGILGAPSERYLILEVSAELRERQQETLRKRAPRWHERVQWLEVLPGALRAIVLGNEVLDAIPTAIVRVERDAIEELGVSLDPAQGFVRAYRPAEGELLAAAQTLALAEDYETEINLPARAFVASFGRLLQQGVLLFIDYGFPQRELYHPQRSRGTLMCHYRHRSHDDPFFLVGLQDITAHVDFSAVASAGVSAGLELLGYTTQAQFLINCGITDLMSAVSPDDIPAYAPLAAQAQKLLAPSEMGELFKVIALGKGVEPSLRGFMRGDKSHTL